MCLVLVQIALGDPVAETEVTNSRALWVIEVIEAGALGNECWGGGGHVPQHGGAGVLCSQAKHPPVSVRSLLFPLPQEL